MSEPDECTLPVSVCIPTIPPRAWHLRRAVASVLAQTSLPAEVVVVPDRHRAGAGVTRNRCVELATQEWVAFLDDDDELYSVHLHQLYSCALATGADVVYPWFDCTDDTVHDRVWPGREYETWDNDDPQIIPITALVRARFAHQAKFAAFDRAALKSGAWDGDDWPFWREVIAAGAKIVHLPLRTWFWHHHRDGGGNTSGLPHRW